MLTFQSFNFKLPSSTRDISVTTPLSMGEGRGEGLLGVIFWGDKTSLISQSAVGRLEETRCLSLVVEEKSSLVNRSGIALLGKSYL